MALQYIQTISPREFVAASLDLTTENIVLKGVHFFSFKNPVKR